MQVDMGGTGRVRRERCPPESSESPWNLLKMVVHESEEGSAPQRAPSLWWELCVGTSNVVKSIHLLCKKTRDDKGEHHVRQTRSNQDT